MGSCTSQEPGPAATGLPCRSAPLYWQAAPVAANEFVPRLLDELGTQFGMELVDHGCRVVMVACDGDDWIRAVARARDCGGLQSQVATFSSGNLRRRPSAWSIIARARPATMASSRSSGRR